MLRAALFAVVGVGFFVRWLQGFTNPNYQTPASVSDWFAVLSFSASLIALAFALPILARLTGERVVFRVSLIPAVGAALGGVSNLLEDGLQLGWAFWLFVLSLWINVFGLAALAVVVAFIGRGGRRLFAAIPAATLVGQLLFPIVGGVLMLAAWLAAAAFALGRPAPSEPPASP